jgi:hypothetical protein
VSISRDGRFLAVGEVSRHHLCGNRHR